MEGFIPRSGIVGSVVSEEEDKHCQMTEEVPPSKGDAWSPDLAESIGERMPKMMLLEEAKK